MRIDSHHHFWKYDAVEHSWIGDAMKVIRRDFLPEHLFTEILKAGVEGVVSVQARQNQVETQWLLDFAAQHHFIKGVVAWMNLFSPEVGAELEDFAINRKLKSVRHVVQSEVDDNFILRDDFNRGIRKFLKYSLAYDILIFEWHLPRTVKFVDAHPDQIFGSDICPRPHRQAAHQGWAVRALEPQPPRTGEAPECLLQSFRHGNRS
jgi:L-fuconolactonase